MQTHTYGPFVIYTEPNQSLLKRIATMNAPWLGWQAEATCDLGTYSHDGKLGIHFRVGTLWCWAFLLLGLAAFGKLVRV